MGKVTEFIVRLWQMDLEMRSDSSLIHCDGFVAKTAVLRRVHKIVKSNY